ncbi:hypothetical protein [Maridesulfovibrio sp.]|uniref:hypothetical protein n=1 Tax=Maridesulfovibrio sp. TaxID=2795000 RepID=UPI002AA6E9BB|nr:hypothetical protein [Maridesulfovibrio sp.]
MKNIILICLILFLVSGCGGVAGPFLNNLKNCPDESCLISYAGYPSSQKKLKN